MIPKRVSRVQDFVTNVTFEFDVQVSRRDVLVKIRFPRKRLVTVVTFECHVQMLCIDVIRQRRF